ncbi:helix-turn-helix domain-containing protein [Nocardia sp. NPDC004168]|uniref:GlxA family transcriptional regulator n=1 Tax=Nocardia sp. NPDC004168 TaxID=3154452 RepID=UPI0033A4F93E
MCSEMRAVRARAVLRGLSGGAESSEPPETIWPRIDLCLQQPHRRPGFGFDQGTGAFEEFGEGVRFALGGGEGDHQCGIRCHGRDTIDDKTNDCDKTATLCDMKIGVAAIAGGWDSGLTTVLDVLRTAEAARERVDRNIPAISVRTIAATPAPIPTQGGLLVPIDFTFDDARMGDLDILVIPAIGANSPPGVIDALLRPDIHRLRTQLRDWADEGRQLAAACTGTLLLAEAGILNGRRATTSWWLTTEFQRRYPRVDLDMTRMVVQDGHITTAGAAFAHIDLAINLVARASSQLADFTAATLLIDERPSRSIESALGYLSSTDRLITDFENWIRAHLTEPISIADAATAIGTTRRTLERHVRQQLGTSPNTLVQHIRAERARHLQRTTDLPLTKIAPMVGYQSSAALRNALAASECREHN